MLIREVIESYHGKVDFVSEDWGKSALAKRYGIERYPVVFVNDILFAQPKDFGGWDTKSGKYAPWTVAANQDRFAGDLKHIADLLLVGNHAKAALGASSTDTSPRFEKLPNLILKDITGKAISLKSLKGHPVIVDFWGTWCVPCRPAAEWLSSLQSRYGKRLTILGIAMESPKADILRFSTQHSISYSNVVGTSSIAASFGGIYATPTLFVFDENGKLVLSVLGVPPGTHSKVEKLIKKLIKSG